MIDLDLNRILSDLNSVSACLELLAFSVYNDCLPDDSDTVSLAISGIADHLNRIVNDMDKHLCGESQEILAKEPDQETRKRLEGYWIEKQALLSEMADRPASELKPAIDALIKKWNL